jgi:hypothetical protein
MRRLELPVYLQVFGENADDWDEFFEIVCKSKKRI